MASHHENENHELVEVPTTQTSEQDVVSVSYKQTLSASLLKQINQEYAPFYKLTQQPTMMLEPVEPVQSEGPADKSVPEIAISTDTMTENKKDDGIIMATPISWSAPPGVKPSFCTNTENQMVERREEVSSRGSFAYQFSFSERKENWIIRRLPRTKGNRYDPYYVHLKSDYQFRSLLAAHAFVLHGILPERRTPKKEETQNDVTDSSAQATRSRKVRGDKLLNRIPVGHYNYTTGEIVRKDTPAVEGDPSSARIDDGNKRKREDETPAEGGEEVSDAAHETTQLIFTLYDFEPLN